MVGILIFNKLYSFTYLYLFFLKVRIRSRSSETGSATLNVEVIWLGSMVLILDGSSKYNVK